MKNTEKLLTLMLQNQEERKTANDKYEKRMSEIERTKGSPFYTEESKKAVDTKNDELNTIYKKYFPAFQSLFNDMAMVNATRKMDAPTQEQLNLINALKMKKNITDTDFTAAAHSLASNGLALGLLQELAQERGSARNYLKYGTSNELSVPATEQVLRNMWDSTLDYLSHSTTRASRLNRDFKERHGYETPPLIKRPAFNTKAEMFSQISDLTEDGIKAFCMAVDGED